MVAGRLCAELCRKAAGIEKRREMGDNNALAFGVLVSAHLRICGCKKRMRLSLDAASGATGEGAITGLDRFAVAAEEIIRDTQILRCQGMRAVKAEGAFEPRQSFLEPACPHQNIPSLPIVFR